MNLERNGDLTAKEIAQRFISFDADEDFLQSVVKMSDRRFNEVYETYLKMAEKDKIKTKKLFLKRIKSKTIRNEADYLRIIGFTKIIAIKTLDKGILKDPEVYEFMESFRDEARRIFENTGDKYSDDQFNRMFTEIKRRAVRLYFRIRGNNEQSIKNNGTPLSFEDAKSFLFDVMRDEDGFALSDYVDIVRRNKFIEYQTEYINLLFMWRNFQKNKK